MNESIKKSIEKFYLKYKDQKSFTTYSGQLIQGELASYIPELAHVSPELFAISVTTIEGENFSCGDSKTDFTLQSTSKPFMYGLALQDHGAEFVHTKVGVEPSGEAFNSIIELEKNTHRPFNPMINSGAIAIANLIKSKNSAHQIDRMLDLYSQLSNRSLKINHQVFESEKKTAHRNRAIAHLLRHFNVIDDDIEESLDLYFKQCSVMANIENLSMMAATLANHGVQPQTKVEIFKPMMCRQILSLMFSCGMYDTAGTWAYKVGVPAKSGVSGAMFAVVPNKLAIAVYSPLIDEHGHSLKALNVIQDFCAEMGFNLYA